MFGIGEARDGYNGTEYLFTHDFVGLERAGDQRGLVEETAAGSRLAPDHHFHMLGGDCALHESSDALAVLAGDERPDLAVFFLRRAVLDARNGGAQIGDQLVVDLRTGVNAARSRA